jgi:hypothetical protein
VPSNSANKPPSTKAPTETPRVSWRLWACALPVSRLTNSLVRARRGIDREVSRVLTGAWVHQAAAWWVQDGAGRVKEGSHGRCWTQRALLVWQWSQDEALLWGAQGTFGTGAGEGLLGRAASRFESGVATSDQRRRRSH